MKRTYLLFAAFLILAGPMLIDAATVTKGLIGMEDLSWFSGDSATFTRRSSTGRRATLSRIPVVPLSNYPDLRTAVAKIGSTQATIWLNQSDASSTTVPSTLSVVPMCDKVQSGTVVWNGTVDDPGECQWLSGSGHSGLKFVRATWLGAVGDGDTNDTAALQNAANSLTTGRGLFDLGQLSYKIAKTQGTNDSWGIKLTYSGVTMRGDAAALRRNSTDISTYALSFPLILIGTPDSNAADAVENVTIRGVVFTGEDARHASNGSSLHDGRYAIELKNTKGVKILDNVFNAVDSSAIYFQPPNAYDYVGAAYYNTTKNYNATISGNSFYGVAHETVNRALLHAIVVSGVDNLGVTNNYFEWCDDALHGEGTYDDLEDVEGDTWSADVGSVNRTGRGFTITGNRTLNSSEHAFYLTVMDVVLSNNVIRTDNPTVCNTDPVKVRGRNVVIEGNVITGYERGMSISNPAFNVTVSNNVIFTDDANGSATGGMIEVESTDISAFIDARDWLDTYYSMSNISITGNTIIMEPSACADEACVGIRVFSDATDANYSEYNQIHGVQITGNTIKNHRIGVYLPNNLIRQVSIVGNTFIAKPFEASGFAGGTTMNTYATLMVDDADDTTGEYVNFRNNQVRGSTYLFATDDGAGTLVHLPWGITGNDLSYIKNFATADMRPPDALNNFTNNNGVFFLDRTIWTNGYALSNSLGDGSTVATYRDFGQLWDQLALANEATPSVFGRDTFTTGGTTTISDFDGGVDGQIITVTCAHSLTFDTTTGQDADNNLDGSSADITADAGDVLVWANNGGTTWNLVSYLDASVDNN